MFGLVFQGRSKVFYLKEGTVASEELASNLFVMIVYLTQIPVEEISCTDILAKGRSNNDQMVYFGPAEDVKVEGKKGYSVTQVSLYDRFEFSEQNVGFFYNEDKECAKKHGLDENKQFLVMFSGGKTVPYV